MIPDETVPGMHTSQLEPNIYPKQDTEIYGNHASKRRKRGGRQRGLNQPHPQTNTSVRQVRAGMAVNAPKNTLRKGSDRPETKFTTASLSVTLPQAQSFPSVNKLQPGPLYVKFSENDMLERELNWVKSNLINIEESAKECQGKMHDVFEQYPKIQEREIGPLLNNLSGSMRHCSDAAMDAAQGMTQVIGYCIPDKYQDIL